MTLLRTCAVTLIVALTVATHVNAQRLALTLQDAQTTGNGTVVALHSQAGGIQAAALFVEWSAGTTAGIITIEEAYESGYTGTWSVITTATWSAASESEVIHLSGVYRHVRARISTTVTGGTVTVRLIGN